MQTAQCYRRLYLVSAMVLSLVLFQPGLLPAQEAASFDLAALSWIAGCWRVATSDESAVAEEQWMLPQGGLMVGMSRNIRNGIATGHELMTLRMEAGRLIYRADPSGQEPAEFLQILVVDKPSFKQVVFTNPEHDFPRRIEYSQEDGNSLSAAVFGDVDDDDPAFVVPYQRVTCHSS